MNDFLSISISLCKPSCMCSKNTGLSVLWTFNMHTIHTTDNDLSPPFVHFTRWHVLWNCSLPLWIITRLHHDKHTLTGYPSWWSVNGCVYNCFSCRLCGPPDSSRNIAINTKVMWSPMQNQNKHHYHNTNTQLSHLSLGKNINWEITRRVILV